jgi:hypothetical protein
MSSGYGLEHVTSCKELSKRCLHFFEAIMTENEAGYISKKRRGRD